MMTSDCAVLKDCTVCAGDTVNEAELRGLFANAAGFRQLKLIRGNKSTTCFVEFSDIPTAMACHAAQQVQISLALSAATTLADLVCFHGPTR